MGSIVEWPPNTGMFNGPKMTSSLRHFNGGTVHTINKPRTTCQDGCGLSGNRPFQFCATYQKYKAAILKERHEKYRQQFLQRGKRKSESVDSGTQNYSDVGQHGPDALPHIDPPKKPHNSQKDTDDKKLQSSVTVQIVQEQQTIQTNVTIKNLNQDLQQLNCSSSIQTNIECKRERQDDSHCNASSSSSHTSDSLNSLGFDADELQAILENLEKEEDGEVPPELLPDLDKLTEQFRDTEESLTKDLNLFANSNTPVEKGSPNMQTPPFVEPGNQVPPAMINPMMQQQSQSQQPQPKSVGNPPQMAGMNNATLPSYRPPQNINQVMGDTGPAAETLKQMAAQHQQQQNQQGYSTIQKPNYDPVLNSTYSRNSAYRNYGTAYNGSERMYPYSQVPSQRGCSDIDPYRPAGPTQHSMPTLSGKRDPSLSYGATKPLSHYNEPMGNQSGPMPSSLQQLQNQVQSHFSQNGQHQVVGMIPPMRLQMSQSQQMHINGQSQQISVAQQQTFTMSQSHGPKQPPGPPLGQQYAGDQMNMQMAHDKMHGQRQAPVDNQMMNPQSRMQQQQFMNRAPPEYKMAMGNQSSYRAPVSNNPLQTMQNMVNQTPQQMQSGMGQSEGYIPNVKTEMNQMQSQMTMNQPQPPIRHMSASSVAASSQGNNVTFPSAQQMQRPQMYHNSMAHQTIHTSGNSTIQNGQNGAPKSNTPVFTSAIMRGQRPPNVNVGPDGLNISHQRPTNGEWPKMSGQPPPSSQVQDSSGMVLDQYSGYQLQQQQYMQASVANGNQMGQQGGSSMMMQNMHLRQQQQMHMQQGNQPMSNSVAMTTTSHSSNANAFPRTNDSNFPLDFFDDLF